MFHLLPDLKDITIREKQQDNPNYEEIIRRAIADEKDFADVYAYIDKDDVIYNEGTQEEFFDELYKQLEEGNALSVKGKMREKLIENKDLA